MSVFASLFSFKGRLRRIDFWVLSASLFITMATVVGLAGEWLRIDVADPTNPQAVFLQLAAVLLFLWPNFAVCAKRLHDRGLSGWWVLLSFLPVIGNIWLVVNLGVLRGHEGANRYGPEPSRPQLTLIPRGAAFA